MANYSMTLKGPLKNRSVIFLTTQKTWNYKLFMVVEHLMLAIHWLVSVLQAWWHFFFFNLKWFTLNLKHFYKNLCMQESHPLLKLHEVPTTDSKFEYSEARQRCMSPTCFGCPTMSMYGFWKKTHFSWNRIVFLILTDPPPPPRLGTQFFPK